MHISICIFVHGSLCATFFLVAESMARLNDGKHCRARKILKSLIALRAGTL